MTGSDCNVILLRLDHQEDMLNSILEEVKRTNGRVTELEMDNAERRGRIEGKRFQTMIIGTVISGSILSGIVWFVTMAI